MRKELKEYNYDWMLWSLFKTASKARNSTQKEYKNLLTSIPHFRNVAEALMNQEEVGVALSDMIAKYLENIITAHEKGKKIAITTFCFNPAIFYAMDVVPVTLEVMTVSGTLVWRRGTAAYLDHANEAGFTETSCSSQRGSLGAYLAGLGEPIDFIVCDSPGVCDTNANSFAFASSYMNLPLYSLDYPPVLTEQRASEYHAEDFKHLIKFIEEQTGSKLNIDRLREVLEEMNKQAELITEIEELCTMIPSPVPGVFHFFIYACQFLFAGLRDSTVVLELILKKIKENVAKGITGLKSGKEKVRALMCYIDHYTTDMRFWNFMENNDVTICRSILSTFWQKGAPYTAGKETEAYYLDTTSLDAMINSIAAANSRMPMIKQIRGPYDSPGMWLTDTLAEAKLYKADCIIYSGTPGCRNTWGMVKLLARDTEAHGYPTHIMYSDAFDDRVQSWDATASRLEEFLNVRRLLP